MKCILSLIVSSLLVIGLAGCDDGAGNMSTETFLAPIDTDGDGVPDASISVNIQATDNGSGNPSIECLSCWVINL